MIDTIIVDDEYIIRERLMKCVEWNQLGYQVVGECENGLQALEMVDTRNPKLAIVDINMPIMNGLKFAEYIANKSINLYIIIITGYAEFEYAKNAMASGVFRYLLKPINMDELNQALVDLVKLIDKDLQEKNEVRLKKRQLFLAEERFKEQELLEYLTSRTDQLSMGLFEKFNEMEFIEKYYVAAIISINDVDDEPNNKNEKLWVFSLQNILKEHAKDLFEVSFVTHYDGYLIACFCNKHQVLNDELVNFFEKYIQVVHQLLPIKITIGVGKLTKDIEGLPVSYKEAKLALTKRLVIGNCKVIYFDDEGYQSDYGLDISFLNQFIMNIRIGEMDKVNEIMTLAKDNIIHSKVWHTSLHNLVSMIMIVIETLCKEFHLEYHNFLAQDVTSLDIISEFETLDEIISFLLDKINLLVNKINRLTENRKSSIIYQIINYIECHYSDLDLSLKKICSEIPANISYVSSQFKKEIGINANTYITNKRMEEAQKLKISGEYTVDELAIKVGYKDPYYFSKCYKKYFGVSPSKGQILY